MRKKKLYIRTYGCQMNVYDSGRMADVLAPLGYESTDSPDDADLVVLNSCHIREKATEKIFSELGRLRELRSAREKKGRRRMTIAVAGCVAQAEGALITERAPYVDMVIGPQSYHRLPELVARAERCADVGGRGILATDFPPESKFDHLPPPGARGPSAFLSVQEGCDKFCTFCVVPYTRGAEYSRPAADIMAEARVLASSGVREITLLGQNVNAYRGRAPVGNGTWGLGRLIRELATIDALARLRYTTSHPRDLDDDLIRTHAAVSKLVPSLHLPIQSGSDRILRAMNRGHTVSEYVDTISRLREVNPHLALSGDFIVGFPGETEDDFKSTLDLARRLGYVQSYAFKYSPRPGTPAASLPNRVSDEVARTRLAKLTTMLDEQQVAFNKSFVGEKMAVLLERPGRRKDQLVGRTLYNQPIHVDDVGALEGEIVEVRVVHASARSLAGERLGDDVSGRCCPTLSWPSAAFAGG